jgi:phytoene dehydrogenase-like protein
VRLPKKSLIIIGGGLAGLATGCYGQMNDYETKIFETQEKPGGVCVSWKRKGYSFDYAVHNVFGVTPNSVNNSLWQELGALHGLQAHSFKEFTQVEDTDGKKFTVFTDLKKLETHMKALAPNDHKLIEEFVSAVHKFSGYDLFSAMSGGVATKLKMLPLMGTLMKYSKITIRDYAEKFADPFMKKAFATIQYDIPEAPVVITLIFLASLSQGDGGWPIGGSMALARNIEKRYLELGGKIFYNSKVSKITVKEGKAAGVQLEDGSEHFAEIIVSAADGYSTIYKMLEGKYVTPIIGAYYEAYPKTQPFGLEIWYGVNKQFQNEPHSIVLFLDQPITVEDRKVDRLDIEVFNFDPSLKPECKTVIKVVLDSDYDYWKTLYRNREEYKIQKQKLAKEIAEHLEKRFPELISKIEAADVVTPISVEHWTSAYRGCQAWGAPKQFQKEVTKNGVSKSLPGLENFFMVGQWAIGTVGLNTACLTGRNLIRDLCKRDNKKFQASRKL